ncbi:hypothetical protein GMLC_28070 [Geomonas limicola]|uniref:Haloacid dehalogenase n=1 Tax=Geomonas limicola TaxID=2740186 RepID=A0A6V8N9I4_9BACT|nr:HAD-IB family hydrolase [Geomonas limicola]GFO69228.1 hypothetical protein GMLC_28070 [Geomonas limicola]
MQRLIFDFDGTITSRDTTRFLVAELLRARPWKTPVVAAQLAPLIAGRSTDAIQSCKLRCIGEAIRGTTEQQLSSALDRFASRVRALFRPELIKTIEQHREAGGEVILASASPGFALRPLFAEYGLTVIATEFECRNGIFTGRTIGSSCFGEAKAEAVRNYLHSTGDREVAAAWSDSITDLPVMLLARDRVWYCSADHAQKMRQADPEGNFVISP